jgi:hypothetical protein
MTTEVAMLTELAMDRRSQTMRRVWENTLRGGERRQGQAGIRHI